MALASYCHCIDIALLLRSRRSQYHALHLVVPKMQIGERRVVALVPIAGGGPCVLEKDRRSQRLDVWWEAGDLTGEKRTADVGEVEKRLLRL